MDKVQFTRKPFMLDGVQITLQNVYEVTEWCKGTVVDHEYRMMGMMHVMPAIELKGTEPGKEKTYLGRLGDWVIKHKNNFRIYKPGQLEALFDMVNEFDNFSIGDGVTVVGDAPEDFAGLTGVVEQLIGRDTENHSWKVSVRFEPGAGSGVCLLTKWLTKTGVAVPAGGPTGVLVLQPGTEVYHDSGTNLVIPDKTRFTIPFGDMASKNGIMYGGDLFSGRADRPTVGGFANGDLAETKVKHSFDGVDYPVGTTVRIFRPRVTEDRTDLEVLFSDGHYGVFNVNELTKI